MQKFISCDWGTSVLRMRLIHTDNLSVLAEVVSPQGISATFNLWKQSEKLEGERLSFYQSILTEQIKKLEEQTVIPLQNVPLIISGMASSNIGMMELAYKEIPFNVTGNDLNVKWIEETNELKHKTLLISGVKTANDVMRGEEAQLAGCGNDNNNSEYQLFIFPGTHSKHVSVKEGKAVDFKTYMTGEFFELLCKKSTLSGGVEDNEDLFDKDNFKNFEKGVKDSISENILHSSFLVRTNYLLNKLTKKENYYYLSGLLIGTELKELKNISVPLVLVSNKQLKEIYLAALRIFGLEETKVLNADEVLIAGHYRIYNQNKF
ncbi:MAG: 2-dehydro-3-deoxygalactonokinase [Ginsengibacter sp.]